MQFKQTLTRLFFIVLLLVLLNTSLACGANSLKVCYSINPPWKMADNGTAVGPAAEILRSIGKNLNIQVDFEIIPFKRCLLYMKNGEFDIMTGLLKNTDREQYISYVDPPYKTKSNKTFYVQTGKSSLINEYNDLQSLQIGIKTGSSHFPRFDNDPQLHKISVNSLEQLINMLLKGRLDTFITTDSTGDFLIHQLGLENQIEKARYGFYNNNPVYIGISKKSPFLKNNELTELVSKMITSGETDAIITSFFQDRGLPIPEYK